MPVTVVTHSDAFHLDEVMATAMIRKVEGPVEIIRTRDLDLIDNLHNKTNSKVYVVDVGLVDDSERLRFDHHQPEFERSYPGCSTSKLSSCGLVYLHLGERLWESLHPNLNTKAVRDSFYYNFILAIDAGDNGVDALKDEFKDKKVYRYYNNLHLNQLISKMNEINTKDHTQQLINFHRAVDIASTFLDVHMSAVQKKLENEELNRLEFQEAYYNREQKEILILESKFPVRWFLKTYDRKQEIKFYLRYSEDVWQVNTVSKPNNNFEPLIPLLAHDKCLELVGSDLIIAKSFIAKCHTKAAVLQIVQASLQAAK